MNSLYRFFSNLVKFENSYILNFFKTKEESGYCQSNENTTLTISFSEFGVSLKKENLLWDVVNKQWIDLEFANLEDYSPTQFTANNVENLNYNILSIIKVGGKWKKINETISFYNNEILFFYQVR